jgi:hypothetical protein
MLKVFKPICVFVCFGVLPILHAQYAGGSGKGEVKVLFGGTLNGDQVATQIVFSSFRSDVAPAEVFFTRVELRDALGNTAVFSPLANSPISLEIENNPSSGTLIGTTTINATDADATFSGLSINNAGFGYTLKATASSLSVVSSNLDVFNKFSGGTGKGDVRSSTSLLTLSGQPLFVWRGGAAGNQTNWSTSANWMDGTPPGVGDIVYIEPNSNGFQPDLSSHVNINTLNFNAAQKRMNLGAFNITITGSIYNANVQNYFKTASTGMLKHSISAAESFQFPVGNSAYNPVAINNNTLNADVFSARIIDEVYENGTNGNVIANPRIKRTWLIDKDNPTANSGSGVDFTFNWNAGEATAGLTTHKLYHHNGIGWQKQTGTSTVSGNSLTYNSFLGSFSPFAIGDDLIALPITFANLRCDNSADNSVKLEWSAVLQHNILAFFVERSTDGYSFETIAMIPVADYSQTLRSYSFADFKPLPDGGYYRIRMEDQNGKVSYSQFCVSKNKRTVNQPILRVFPSPTDGKLTVIAQEPERNFTWIVYTISGTEITRGYSMDGKTTIDLTFLSAGLYNVKITTSSLSEVHPILIQH